MNISLNERIKEIAQSLFDIQYKFEGYSDNVQVEKDFSNTLLPIYKRFAKNLLNGFKTT